MLDSNTKAEIDHGSTPFHVDGSSADEIAVNATTNRGAEKAKSAAAEIAKTPLAAKPDPVGDAIKKCNEVAEGGNVFEASKAHIFVGLTAAYSIVDALMAKGNRERMPSLNKPAYNSTVLACHPDNPESWTLASDWANVLVRADIEKVSPDAFAVWVKDKTIRESKRVVRAQKQASKALKMPSVGFMEADFPALAHFVKHCDDDRMRQAMRDGMTQLDLQLSQTLATMKVVVD